MFNISKQPESKIKIILLQTKRNFRVRYKHQGKTYIFTVIVTDILEGTRGVIRNIEAKRMKLHKDDCKEILTRKTVETMKEDITKRFRQ